MSEPFLGEIKVVSFNFPPKGWAFCNGQLLPINQNQALFSILGVAYGGNGTTNFALPDLRDRMPVHTDAGAGLSVGVDGGEVASTLTVSQLPAHGHAVSARSTGNSSNPVGNHFAGISTPMFAAAADTTMSSSALTAAGGGQPHENRGPYLVLNFVIALSGIYPSRD
jgi:microcystin-dependent protein